MTLKTNTKGRLKEKKTNMILNFYFDKKKSYRRLRYKKFHKGQNDQNSRSTLAHF